MRTCTDETPVRPTRTPAVVVSVLLGAMAVFLIAVSTLVEAPVPVTPGGGVGTAVTPTRSAPGLHSIPGP